ncbi:unnamed protein product [Adineta ricciae]|uniref:Uncharacterized protein n=1 Tax=Adineta ricciae TaxID=249248 RepID=A0A815TPL0_ADIRI|nr:unnamed protein product [Adineta ricciae]
MKQLQCLVVLFLSIEHIQGISFNQPNISLNSSWNPNAAIVVNQSIIGSTISDFFITTNNSIFISNGQQGQVLLLDSANSGNVTDTRNTSINSSSLFVGQGNQVYFDSFSSVTGGVSQIGWNSSTHPTLIISLCQQCFDIFVDSDENLFCSISARHQVLFRSLQQPSTHLMIAAGTGSKGSTATTLSQPKGIFVDTSIGDLFVADCDNNRVQLFHHESLVAQTVVANRSSNVTFTLDCPSHIVLDSNKLLFIVDSNNGRVVRQTSNGFTCIVGCGGTQVTYPSRIAFDSVENLFVLDQSAHRLWKFDLITWKSAGTTNGSLGWITTGNMSVARYGHTATILSNGTVLVTSGYNGVCLSSAELYNPLTGSWTTGTMSVVRSAHTATSLSNGNVLFAGGDNCGSFLSSAELYQ